MTIYSCRSIAVWRAAELAGWQKELAAAEACKAAGIMEVGGEKQIKRFAPRQRKPR